LTGKEIEMVPYDKANAFGCRWYSGMSLFHYTLWFTTILNGWSKLF